MVNKIKIGYIAVANVDDKHASGFYVLKWTPLPYTSQDNGELLCNGYYYEATYGKRYLCNL